jgi:uncharacterized BrkB/YihY/UPF0761 family membrane protein
MNSIVGLLAILTVWFWIISLILVVGAEVNSYYAMGQRAAAGELPSVLRRLNGGDSS